MREMMSILETAPPGRCIFPCDGIGIGAMACRLLGRSYVSGDLSEMCAERGRRLGVVCEPWWQTIAWAEQGDIVVLSQCLYATEKSCEMVDRALSRTQYVIVNDPEQTATYRRGFKTYSPLLRSTVPLNRKVVDHVSDMNWKRLSSVALFHVDTHLAVPNLLYLKRIGFDVRASPGSVVPSLIQFGRGVPVRVKDLTQDGHGIDVETGCESEIVPVGRGVRFVRLKRKQKLSVPWQSTLRPYDVPPYFHVFDRDGEYVVFFFAPGSFWKCVIRVGEGEWNESRNEL